jgi:hypothetical protein
MAGGSEMLRIEIGDYYYQIECCLVVEKPDREWDNEPEMREYETIKVFTKEGRQIVEGKLDAIGKYDKMKYPGYSHHIGHFALREPEAALLLQLGEEIKAAKRGAVRTIMAGYWDKDKR